MGKHSLNTYYIAEQLLIEKGNYDMEKLLTNRNLILICRSVKAKGSIKDLAMYIDNLRLHYKYSWVKDACTLII